VAVRGAALGGPAGAPGRALPADSAIAQPVTTGKYISAYWITAGRLADHMLFTNETNKRLRNDGGGSRSARTSYTAFQDYLGATYRDRSGPRDLHALDHPYPALVVEVLDGQGAGDDITDLDRWLADDYVPALQEAAPAVSQTLRFRPRPLPPHVQRRAWTSRAGASGSRCCTCWTRTRSPSGGDVRAARHPRGEGRPGQAGVLRPVHPDRGRQPTATCWKD